MLKLLSLCILLFFSCTTLPPPTQTLSPEPNIPEVSNSNHSNLSFTELWGYVLAGKEAGSKLDKAQAKGIVHKNYVARQKSELATAVNTLK